MDRRYLSVNKFVEYIKSMNLNEYPAEHSYIFFDPKETFENKFDQECIKPIGMLMDFGKNKIGYEHPKLLEIFNGEQIIITIKLSERSKMMLKEMKDNQLAFIEIDFESKFTDENYLYYPHYVKPCDDERINKKFLDKVVVKKKEKIDFSDFNF